MPSIIEYNFNYNAIVNRRNGEKCIYINKYNEKYLFSFIYSYGEKKEYKYLYVNSFINGSLKYKSQTTGKLSITKHFDIEIFTIPKIIELFDVLIEVDHGNIIKNDILIGGFIDSQNNYDEKSARSGITGNGGIISSQSSPEISYSLISGDFKFAHKMPIPITHGKEFKSIYTEILNRKYYFNEKFILLIYNGNEKIFSINNVKRIYIKYSLYDYYINNIISYINDFILLYKNKSIIKPAPTNANRINKKLLFTADDIIKTDIIKNKYYIVSSMAIIIYYNVVDNKETFIIV